MNKLKNKVLKYLLNNEGKKILIDTKTEINSDQIVDLAISINKRKIINKKIIINIERSETTLDLFWLYGLTVIQ